MKLVTMPRNTCCYFGRRVNRLQNKVVWISQCDRGVKMNQFQFLVTSEKRETSDAMLMNIVSIASRSTLILSITTVTFSNKACRAG